MNIVDTLNLTRREIKVVEIGKYVQNATGNIKSPLRWFIIAEKEDCVLVITEKIIERKRFNDGKAENEWENCTLRQWLNSEFLQSFSSDELEQIVPDSELGDKVWLINSEIYFRHLQYCEDANMSDYVQSLTKKDFGIRKIEPKGFWWTRTPTGEDELMGSKYLLHICADGGLNPYANSTSSDGVRPAMWIKK